MASCGKHNRAVIDRRHLLGDRVGVWASLACALHCALLPVVILLLPTLGVGLVGGLDVDQVFVVFATLLGVVTLTQGYRRHRDASAWVLLLAGLVLVWVSTFTSLHTHSLWHTGLMVVGGLLIAAAHLANIRLTALFGSCNTA